MRGHRVILLIGLATLAAPAAAQMPSSRPHEVLLHADALPALHELWRLTLAAREERAACLGGRIEQDTAWVERLKPLTTAAGDSLAVSAEGSLEDCSPPEWFGTVHTHVPLHDTDPVYSKFSGSDQGVMLAWVKRWRTSGVFCILFSESDARCQVEGIEGVSMVPKMRY
ncbi:MAG: hypothetical protein SGJ01_06785 [Gemmatimonadota bacterium]|nr:hypothetical protein [Gemmatimonadota bacterium]